MIVQNFGLPYMILARSLNAEVLMLVLGRYILVVYSPGGCIKIGC